MSQGVIQGSMREAPLPDIIQLVSQGGKSGCFHVEQDASKVRIYLKEGRIIHAVTPAGEGLDGLMGVAFWTEGTYRFEEGVPFGADIIEHERLGAGEMGIDALTILGGDGDSHVTSFDRRRVAAVVIGRINQP